MRSIRTYLKLALLCTVLSGFVGCSNNDDIVPENKNEKLAGPKPAKAVSYTHLRAHETLSDLVCRLLLEKKK